MVGGRVVAHRVGQSALVFEPIVALLGQGTDAVLGEEGRVHRTAGGLPVDRLGAVLAELDHVASRRFAPGTTGAVEAAVLVGLEHHAQVLEGILAAQPGLGHALERAPTGGRAVVTSDMFFFAHRATL